MALDLGLADDENLDFLNKVSEHFIPRKSIPSLVLENSHTPKNDTPDLFTKAKKSSFTETGITPKGANWSNQASDLRLSFQQESNLGHYQNQKSKY
jgi:hypothetical protein